MGKGPTTEPRTSELRSNAEFSHASHGIGHDPSSHIAAYVPVTGVPNSRPLKTCDLKDGTCMHV